MLSIEAVQIAVLITPCVEVIEHEAVREAHFHLLAGIFDESKLAGIERHRLGCGPRCCCCCRCRWCTRSCSHRLIIIIRAHDVSALVVAVCCSCCRPSSFHRLVLEFRNVDGVVSGAFGDVSLGCQPGARTSSVLHRRHKLCEVNVTQSILFVVGWRSFLRQILISVDFCIPLVEWNAQVMPVTANEPGMLLFPCLEHGIEIRLDHARAHTFVSGGQVPERVWDVESHSCELSVLGRVVVQVFHGTEGRGILTKSRLVDLDLLQGVVRHVVPQVLRLQRGGQENFMQCTLVFFRFLASYPGSSDRLASVVDVGFDCVSHCFDVPGDLSHHLRREDEAQQLARLGVPAFVTQSLCVDGVHDRDDLLFVEICFLERVRGERLQQWPGMSAPDPLDGGVDVGWLHALFGVIQHENIHDRLVLVVVQTARLCGEWIDDQLGERICAAGIQLHHCCRCRRRGRACILVLGGTRIAIAGEIDGSFLLLLRLLL